MNNQWKIIKCESEYEKAMSRFTDLMNIELQPNTNELDEFELLTLLISDYESRNYPIELPDPIEAIKFKMEQLGLRQSDMIECFGSAPKVSEVLSRKRNLTLRMIRKLSPKLGIPIEVLIQDIKNIDSVEESNSLEIESIIDKINRIVTFPLIQPDNNLYKVISNCNTILNKTFNKTVESTFSTDNLTNAPKSEHFNFRTVRERPIIAVKTDLIH